MASRRTLIIAVLAALVVAFMLYNSRGEGFESDPPTGNDVFNLRFLSHRNILKSDDYYAAAQRYGLLDRLEFKTAAGNQYTLEFLRPNASHIRKIALYDVNGTPLTNMPSDLQGAALHSGTGSHATLAQIKASAPLHRLVSNSKKTPRDPIPGDEKVVGWPSA